MMSKDRLSGTAHAGTAARETMELGLQYCRRLYGIAREAQIPGLLDAYQIPHPFSSTEVLAVALDKSLTNAVMKSYQVPVADFRVVRQEQDIAKVNLSFPLFVKPVAEGTSKGITARSVIHNQQELAIRCLELLGEFHQPVLVETYLPGREFTVGLLGSGEDAQVLGVMEVRLHGAAETQGYTFENKQQYEDRVSYHLVDEPEVAQLALKAWSALHCLDAGRSMYEWMHRANLSSSRSIHWPA